jgi:predicted dehydrogenase
VTPAVEDESPSGPQPSTGSAPACGVAIIGFGWMGEVHARAYARVGQHYDDAPFRPVLTLVAEASPERADTAVTRFGFAAQTADWHDVLSAPGISAVSVTSPNFLHREMGVAVARAGKHLWIEKPVGLSASDARAVAAAVRDAGVQCTVGFNYRAVPAVALAQALISAGEIGTVTNARVRLFSDYAAHPQGALSWRFERALGGNGALGDLASHGVDLIRFVIGEIDSVVADTAIFIKERPVPSGPVGHFSVGGTGRPGAVENEDYLSALIRTTDGARVVLESSRVSVADQNNYGFEIHGTRGQISWDFRRMNELQVATGGDYLNQFARTVHAGPDDGNYAAFQPGTSNGMSFDDLKVIEALGFLRSIQQGTPIGPTIEDAVSASVALDAMTESARSGGWVAVAR